MKPNCYQCKHRKTVPGSAHSKCGHPEVDGKESPVGELMSLLGGGRSMPLGLIVEPATQKLGIAGDPLGISSGWFNWPYNFDPVWLESCNGFTGKNTQETGERNDKK